MIKHILPDYIWIIIIIESRRFHTKTDVKFNHYCIQNDTINCNDLIGIHIKNAALK